MQTRPIDEKHGQDHGKPQPTADDGRMGPAYIGVIVVEVLVLSGLWVIGTYFGSL